MENKLRVLFVEDSQNDAELIIHRLELASYNIHYERVETAEEMKTRLQEYSWDMILVDYMMPQFDAAGALSIYHEMSLDIPFIILSNIISDEDAVALMKAGAHDYLMKDHLARLIPVVARELNEAKIRNEKRLALQTLEKSKTRLIRGESVSKTGNWELHLDSGVMFGSEGAQKLYGIACEQWSYDSIKSIPLPEYREMLDNAFLQLINYNIPYDVEFKIRQQHSGEIIDIHSIAEYNPNRRVLFGVIQDITERKNAETELINRERRYHELANSLPVSVFETDLTGNITFVNATTIDWFGFTEQEFKAGINIVRFIPEIDIARAIMRLEQIIKPDFRNTSEYLAKRKDGSFFPALISSVGIKKRGRNIWDPCYAC